MKSLQTMNPKRNGTNKGGFVSENWKGFMFLAITTTVAILLVEPLVEKALMAVSPTTAAKLGITA